ncbi:MAG: CoB--CoM heterodisulfide reductase subunit B [Candidatus Sigynarchaeota archaeon]
MVKEKTFAFFLGCIAPNRYPQLEKATKFVMEKIGYTLLDMEQASCCPAPGVFKSFDKYDWMVAAARNIVIAERLDANLVTICNGCFGTLQEVNKHLKEDPKAKEYVNARLKEIGDYEFKGTITVRHAAEVLAYEIGPEGVAPFITRKLNARAVIHYGCHFLKPTRIRGLDSAEKPTMLENFATILGIESLEFENKYTCCGAGGGIKAAHAVPSMKIFGEKMKDIDKVKPDFILDICPFCHLQFETGQDYLNKNEECNYDYPVLHLSQVVAWCMGMDQKFVGLQYQQMGRNYIFPEKEVA